MTHNRLGGHTRQVEPEPLTIESCHSTWIFDGGRMRFRRILKGTEVAGQPVVTGWRSYARLEDPPDSETFTVYLNEAGSRMIRSWRHAADCAQCNEHLTTSMSLEKVRAAIES
jgi:hypothetical protein